MENPSLWLSFSLPGPLANRVRASSAGIEGSLAPYCSTHWPCALGHGCLWRVLQGTTRVVLPMPARQ